MKFANQLALYVAVVVVPVMVIFLIWAKSVKAKRVLRFAEKELVRDVMPSYYSEKKHLIIILEVLAIVFVFLSIANPQWGYLWKKNKRAGLDIVFAVDVSKSMLANDYSPNRLELTKNCLSEFAQNLKNDRVGLIAFAGEAFLQCPITSNYKGFSLALNDLDVVSIPRGGTNIEAAIEAGIRSYVGAYSENKILIIITDGENTEGNISDALNKAIEEKVRIYTIGIGSKEGKEITMHDYTGALTYIRDKWGNIVKSRLMEEVLKDISLKTGGSYVRARQGDIGISEMYNDKLSLLEKDAVTQKKTKVFTEKFQYPLMIALVLIMAGDVVKKIRYEK
jgi:Ca-activated chloride channel family protein